MLKHWIPLFLFFFLFLAVKGKGWEKMKKPAFSSTFPNIDPPLMGGKGNSKPKSDSSTAKEAEKPKREDPGSIAFQSFKNSTGKPLARKSDFLNGPHLNEEDDQNDFKNVTGVVPQGRSTVFGAVTGTAVSAINAVGQTMRNWAGDGFIGRIGKGIQGIAKAYGQVRFLLFTQKTRKQGEIMTLENAPLTSYDRSTELIFIIHGFTHASYYDKPQDNLVSMLRIKDGFMDANFTSNIIVVDWTTLSSDATYIFSSMSTATTAEEVSDFIIGLVTSGFVPNYSWIRLVGHSLGAHASGITGYKVTEKSGGHKLARIDGLDPAGPNFDSYGDARVQISSDDAAFVQIIHCDIKMLGTYLNRGSVDFYPNGGDDQSGCDPETLARSTCNTVSCSRKRAILGIDLDRHSCNHVRCVDLFIESLTTVYKGCRCPSWAEYLQGLCPCPATDQAFMGYYCDENARGMYFLKAPLKAEYEKLTPAYVDFFNTYGGQIEQKIQQSEMLPEILKQKILKQQQSGALMPPRAMPRAMPSQLKLNESTPADKLTVPTLSN